MRKFTQFCFCVIAVCFCFLADDSYAATSLTQHGITWSFDKDYPSGQYANGDYWVVGPVTITAISPRPSSGRNGTMINPARGKSQGFDNRISSYHPYSDALNAGLNLPRQVGVNSSVVSSVSTVDDVSFGQIGNMAVLTVVSSAPVAGSFRPPYIGIGSRASLWKTSNLDYSKLNRLNRSVLGSVPAITTASANFQKVWYEQDLSWTGRYMHPNYIVPNSGYGKDMAIRTGDAGLLLNLDFSNAEKETLLIRLVQYGIDIYGILKDGGTWTADGGHNCGRLTPLIVAAMVLNDSTLKGFLAGTNMRFQEYQQTFVVTQNDVNTPRYTADGRPRLPYRTTDIGLAEWGEKHVYAPERDGNNWSAYYRDIAGGQLTAPATVARVMGARALVSWEVLFNYQVRHINYEQSAGYGGEFNKNPTPAFHKSVYNRYKDAAPPSGGGGGEITPRAATPAIVPSGGAFLGPETITMTTATAGAAIYYTMNGSTPTTNSIRYSGGVSLATNASINAIAVIAGMAESLVSSATFEIGAFSSTNQFKNVAFPRQTNTFTFSFDMIPGGGFVDGLTALSASATTTFPDLAAIVRLATNGLVDARNGGVYQAVNSFAYTSNMLYRVVMVVDTANRRYSATIAPKDGTAVTIASNYAFRTEQASVTSLANLALIATSPGTHRISNVSVIAGGVVEPPPPQPPPPSGSAALPSPPQSTIDAAIAAPLIRYNRTIAGGAHTDGAWHGGASVMLAVASYSGNSSADARLLQQMRYTLTGGNDISANGGYPSQHERHVTAMFAIAKRTPRVWNQLTAAEKTKADLLMKAAFVASAFTTSDNNPYIKAGTQQYALDGDSNLNRDWNPNYREGMIGGVLVGVAYFGGPDAAIAILESYNHTQFVSELAANGLSNVHQTFNWKTANPTSAAPSGTVIQSAIKGYRHYGIGLTNYMGIYNRLLNDTFSKNVNAGLNDGAGINGAGRIVSGAEQLPNKGILGMLKEFDSTDAGGPRSSASYAYDGYRPHRSNQLVLIASGLWPKGSADANTAASRMNVGLTDLWYKIEKGYIGYAKGVSQGTFDLTDGTAWGFVYNRSLWEDVLKPYHQQGATVQQPAATPEISPAGGAYVGPVVVTITSATPDARIYYTVDGNTPTTNSAVYVTPFELAQSGTVNAIAIASGFTASPVRSATFAINSFRSSDQWQNISLPTQKQNFVITFNQTPQTNNMDAVTGLSAMPAANYAELAMIIRFSNTGVVDARNGGVYQAKNVFQYTGGMTYSISISVDFATKRYSATIAVPGDKAVVIAENYAWRTEQSAVTEISNLAFVASSGTHSISDVTIKARPAPPKSLRVVQ